LEKTYYCPDLLWETIEEIGGVLNLKRAKDKNVQALFTSTTFLKGETIIQFSANEILERPTYLTVQTGPDRHITLVPQFLQYINHSCDPNIIFDVDQMMIIAIKDIGNGEELKFFYPSTEWEMDQPFICNCGSSQCLGLISGALAIDSDARHRYQVSNYIKSKWSESDQRKV
jgi:hypothetical protein